MTRAGEIRARCSSMRVARCDRGAHLDLARARHPAADVGNAQAAFPVLDDLVADDGDLGVDERDQRHPVLVLGSSSSSVGREPGDEQPQAFVHLRRRQPDAVVLAHRLDHVVDELLDARRS